MDAVVEFLSPEWIAALDAAAVADRHLGELTEALDLTVEHQVERAGRDPVRYHVTLCHGSVRVSEGPAPQPTVRFSQDEGTAWEVASGTGSAQRAFMAGRLRVGGNLAVLLEHAEVLGQLHDTFAAVRRATVRAG